jgi:hypothetical protein
MKSILLTIFILLCKGALAQGYSTYEIDSIAESKALKLVNSTQIDSVLIYSVGCSGCEVIGGDCACSYGFVNVYLFFKAEGTTQVDLYNCCGTAKNSTVDNFPWTKIANQGDKLFDNEFSSSYLSTHHDFMNLKFVTSEGVEEIRLYDYYFKEDNPHKEKNEQQPARVLQKQIRELLRKRNSR